MNYQKAIVYLKNTIQFNDLEYGSVRQLSEVIKWLESKERADYTMEGANLHPPTSQGQNGTAGKPQVGECTTSAIAENVVQNGLREQFCRPIFRR